MSDDYGSMFRRHEPQNFTGDDAAKVGDLLGKPTTPRPRYGQRDPADLTITTQDAELLSGIPQPLVPTVAVDIEE